jgi:flagellar hook-basal body complex protein FliE
MSIEAIGALAGAAAGLDVAAVRGTQAPGQFSAILDQLSVLNEKMAGSEQAVQQLALGQAPSLHEAMINMESTRLQLELLLQVRNKILDAYQEIMRMQV